MSENQNTSTKIPAKKGNAIKEIKNAKKLIYCKKVMENNRELENNKNKKTKARNRIVWNFTSLFQHIP